MKKFTIGLVLAIMMVFSLSAENKILKSKTVSSIFGEADVGITSIDDDDNITYAVRWVDLDGNDIVNVYHCSSLVKAFNVWNMTHYEIQKISHLIDEHVNAVEDDTLYLYKEYSVNTNADE